MAVRKSAAAFAMLAFLGAQARAESPEPPDPTFRGLRYEDDFSHPNPKSAADFWGPIKYIPLGSDAYMTLGGEVRERFESYDNINFGFSKAAPKSDYLLQRLMFNTDLHVTEWFRAFGQVGSMDRYGNRGASSTTDIDRGEIMQAFLDFRAPGPLGDRPTLRVGREELLFGWQRLIAVREGPNVRRAFDGLRLTDRIGEVSVDLFSVKPVTNNQDSFDDPTNNAQRLKGAYVTAPVPFVPALKADLYVLGYERDKAVFRGITATESRTTYGTRLFGDLKGFDWNFEGDLQRGTFSKYDIRAYWLAASTGYKFEGLAWTPRLGLQANYASGDKGGSTLGTFNALYPRLPYFAEISMLVPSNLKDVRPTLTFNPFQNVQVVLGYDMLWRASTADGLYGSGQTLFAGTNGAKVTASRVGEETSADVRVRVDEHLTLGAIAAVMKAGPALTEAGGKDVKFGVLFAKYKF